MVLAKYHELGMEKAFSILKTKNKNPAIETSSAASIITTIACNEMYEFTKNTTAMEALCQSFSCANAPSCPKKSKSELEITELIAIW